MREKIKRVPSANWRTENLEELWAKTDPSDSALFEGSLHNFLGYCCLLRRIRKQFEADDQAGCFDGYAFFLRGGYFAFKYLNTTSSMALKATIFGGLNHGRHPKLEVPGFINELRDRALSSKKQRAELLIVDEVKSGTGMGTVLNLVEGAMNSWPDSCRCDIDICFYAIRADQMTADLQVVVRKWHGEHETTGGLLSVDIKHFVGPLPGYDSDRLCGVKRVSSSADQSEAYEILKSVGGTIRLTCDSTKKDVFKASIGDGSLVESLSYYAWAWTFADESVVSQTLIQQIELSGCSNCRRLYLESAGL